MNKRGIPCKFDRKALETGLKYKKTKNSNKIFCFNLSRIEQRNTGNRVNSIKYLLKGM